MELNVLKSPVNNGRNVIGEEAEDFLTMDIAWRTSFSDVGLR